MNAHVGLPWRFITRMLLSAFAIWAVVVQYRLWSSGEVVSAEWLPFGIAMTGFASLVWTNWWIVGVSAVVAGYLGLLAFPGHFNSGLWFVLLPLCVEVNFRRPGWPGLCVAGVLTLGSIVDWIEDPGSSFVLVTYIWSLSLLGMFIRGQAEGKQSLQELHALQRAAERQSLAANMHDGAAAVLTQAAMLVRAVLRRAPINEDSRSSLEMVESNLTVALDELRSVVRVLDDGESVRPTGRESLVISLMRARETLEKAGFIASLDAQEGCAILLPGRHTAHLVLGEAVANVLRYGAPGGPAHISADNTGGWLTLAMINQLPPTPSVVTEASGLGLRSLARRVQSEGGRFEAKPEDGAWILRMELPVRSEMKNG
ncbi:MAG TPA: histidine kinase [Arachnia sp.]|nr:histidine kinase [Arachnia sp.]HMT84995.1 histidine kinase [Arachnia sp.]